MSDRSRSPRGAAAPSVADLRAALAEARRRSAESRSRWLGALHRMYNEAHALAVLARRAGASGYLVEYWYTSRTVDEPEPEEEPEPGRASPSAETGR